MSKHKIILVQNNIGLKDCLESQWWVIIVLVGGCVLHSIPQFAKKCNNAKLYSDFIFQFEYWIFLELLNAQFIKLFNISQFSFKIAFGYKNMLNRYKNMLNIEPL